MKKIVSLVMASLIFSSVAMADCKEIYKKQKIAVGSKSILSTGGGTTLAAGGVFVFYVGVVATIFASQNAFLVVGAAAGAVTTGGGIVVSVKGVKNGVDFLKKAQAYKLIKESYVGAGNKLNEVAEELSEQLGRDIAAADVAKIVVAADQANKYCESKETLFTIDQMKADLADQI